MTQKYTIDFYIDFFEKIPARAWNRRTCAFILLVENHPAAAMFALENIFNSHRMDVIDVNDGDDRTYPQPTAKQRMLAACRDIKREMEK